jgi:hypothetical protein
MGDGQHDGCAFPNIKEDDMRPRMSSISAAKCRAVSGLTTR